MRFEEGPRAPEDDHARQEGEDDVPPRTLEPEAEPSLDRWRQGERRHDERDGDLARRFREVHLASAALALMGLSLALLPLARSTAIVFALVASYGIGMPLLTPAVSALVSRRGGAHAGAALGLDSSAKSLGQIAGPVLGGVLFGASVAVPFWLASGLLHGLAPIFAWSGRRMNEPPGGREAKGERAFRRQQAR